MKDKVCVITGGLGLLGRAFAKKLKEEKANVCILDNNESIVLETWGDIYYCDITNITDLEFCREWILNKYGKIDILINCAALDPKVGSDSFSKVENLPMNEWNSALAVGLSGTFLSCKVFGASMTEQGSGVILNIASDLSIIAPDQRIYDNGPKPVHYSVVKHGVVGLTKYLATYWADKGIRVNALSPGGVYTNQPKEFVDKLRNLIPMGRMAEVEDYTEAVVFLCSDASKYMTGQNIVIDGGRTVW